MIDDSLNIGVLVSWNIKKFDGHYYTLNVHYAYLKYLVGHFHEVYLISSTKYTMDTSEDKQYDVSAFENIHVVELPEVRSSAKALLNFRQYYKAIKSIALNVDLFYSRVPDPFSWMPALITKCKTIMHFVGDTIDATKYNEKWSSAKKMVMIVGYLPDWWMTLWAARRSRVYCNGPHLLEKLLKKGVKAEAVVSSTISRNELPKSLHAIPVCPGRVSILFLSYLRYAKGINCLMGVIEKLTKDAVPYHFNIVGDGEMMPGLRRFVETEGNSSHVTLHGYVNDREKINKLMEQSDIFFFASLSEGSPRVVIEAVSRGIPVISTPVGSLPFSFKEGESIRFFPFNDASAACNIIKEFMVNPVMFVKQRDAAFALVRDKFTSGAFMSRIFSYDS